MNQYQDLLRQIRTYGKMRGDRTKTGTLSLFAPAPMRFDLRDGFPALTTKKLHFKSVVAELLWFLRGEPSVQFLHDNKVTIWDEWTSETGDVGRVYGVQWRRWRVLFAGKIDQIKNLITNLKEDPESRRHLVSAWNVGELDLMALPPCHFGFQCYVQDGRLSLNFFMRSADMFLGVPFNIASYALLTHLLARAAGLEVGELVCTITGDAHLYLNHLEQAETLLSREPYAPPTLQIATPQIDIDGYKVEDFSLEDYQHHPTIKAPIAV